MIFLSFEAVATPRLIMKNHGKKIREEKSRRRRRRQRVGPRGCYCGHAVILCLRGEAGNHLGSTYITYTHFHYKFIRHSRFSLSVSLFPGTTQRCSFFLFSTTFLYFRSILLRGSSSLDERERERESVARNYGQNNIFELPLISARGLRVNSLRKINKSVCKAL